MPDNAIATKKRFYPHLDILRIVACYFVILNHSLSSYIESQQESAMWVAAFVPLFISKAAVPIFLMITGTLSLGKVDTYKKSGQKIARAVIVLFLISNLALLVKNLYHGSNIIDFFKSIILFDWVYYPASNALWYMFLYIAILVMMPMLQRLSVKMEKKDFHYFFFFSLIYCGGINLLTHYTIVHKPWRDFSLPVFAVEIGYLFLGYYINKFVTLTKKHAIISAILYVIFNTLNVALTYREFKANPDNFLFLDNRFMLNIIIPSVCLFVVVKYLFQNITLTEKRARLLRELGACTFGAYLIGDIVLNAFFIKGYPEMENALSVLPARLVLSFVAFLITMALAFAVRRIPFARKLI